MHAKYEVSISYGSKLIAKVKVDRQTDRQTNKQTGQKKYAPIIRSGGIKIINYQYQIESDKSRSCVIRCQIQVSANAATGICDIV